MVAQKDDGQKPPEGGRRAVIWRLPTVRSAAAAGAETDRSHARRVPLSIVWGLAAALIMVGLYAAWSTFGRDMSSTSGEPDAAAATAPVPQAAERAVNGPAGGGAAEPPSTAGAGVPRAGVDEDAETVSSNRAAPVVDAGKDIGAGPLPAQAATASPPASDPPPPPSVVAAGGPEAPPPAVAGRTKEAVTAGGEEAVSDAAAVAAVDVGATSAVGADAQAVSQAAAEIEALGAVLEARLSALEAQAGGGAAVTALAQRVRALEDNPARLQLDRALAAWGEQRDALTAALAEVRARLARMEAEAAGQTAADGRLVGLVLAIGELATALGSSRPFAPALDTLYAVAGEDPEIESALAQLAPFAAAGVPTLDGLLARFPEAANAIARGASGADDGDWIDVTVAKLSQLVTIRRTGGAIDSESVDGRLVEAETTLAAGDLSHAIAIVEALVPAAEEGSAQTWLRDANARREVDDTLAGLVAALRGRIGARWASNEAPP